MANGKPFSDRPARIAVVSHYFPAHGGGIERVTERVISEVSAITGAHFIWMASDCDPHPANQAGMLAIPVPAFNLAERMLGVPLPIWGVDGLRKLWGEIGAADAVWLHDTLYFGNIAAFKMARRLGKPVVITQHIGTVPYRNHVLRLGMRVADKAATCDMLSQAFQATFVSDRVAEDYNRRVRFKSPARIIPNGLDSLVFKAPLPDKRYWLRQQFALREEQPVVMFAGRFVEKKGLEVIRRLAVNLPEWRFWLAGQGRVSPERWGLPNVHVFAGRSGESLAELYGAADILVSPGYGEGFPLVVQEALACGLPVVCSPETAAGSIHARPYLHLAEVWPEDPSRTASVWTKCLRDFSARLPLAALNYEMADFAASLWRWDVVAEAYAEIIISACLRRRPPA